MAIGRISGSVLKSNLTRNGTDLAFETNLLYLDVTNSYVGIGTSSPTALLDINGTVNATAVTATAAVTGGTLSASGTGTDALLTLTTTNISGTASPVIDLKRINPNKPADNDKIGQINFIGEATDSSSVTYGRITTSIFDSAASSMDGKMQIMLQEGGTLTNAVRFESQGIFLNTGNYIQFEGSVADGSETILTTINPTDDRTISLPDATGTISLITATETLTNKTLTAPTINAGTMTGDFDFADNSKILMGDGDDLKIYHSGSHSIIQDAGIGYLRIRGSKIQIMGNGNDEMHIVSTEDGSAELYYNGTKTFETTTSGAQIITTSTSDALLIDMTEASSTAGPVLSLKRNSASPADSDYLGQINFKGENDADQEVNYANITGKILDASDGSEDGILEMAHLKNGTSTTTMRFRSDSLQLLNDTNLRVTGHMELGVLDSDPSTTADFAHIYAKDDSASAEVYVRDEAGNVTKLSPHNKQGEWEYFSRNTKTGKTVRVNMEEMIKDIEKLTGKKYIKEE